MKNIINNIVEKIVYRIVKKSTITAKGEMVKLYCKKIVEDTWIKKDYIYDYEKELNEIASEYDVSRKEAANIVLDFFKVIDNVA